MSKENNGTISVLHKALLLLLFAASIPFLIVVGCVMYSLTLMHTLIIGGHLEDETGNCNDINTERSYDEKREG